MYILYTQYTACNELRIKIASIHENHEPHYLVKVKEAALSENSENSREGFSKNSFQEPRELNPVTEISD